MYIIQILFACPLLQTPCCETKAVLCCYQAVNVYYYKYTVQGINIFALSILSRFWSLKSMKKKGFLRKCGVQYRFIHLFSFSLFSPADSLPLVIITLIIGYTDHDHNYFTSVTKFTIAITSIIPLSYFIGMGIAR